MLKELRLDEAAPWKQRFHTPKILSTKIARANPARGLVTSNVASDAFQLYAWDVPQGQLRQLTHRPDGTWEGLISPDGRHVYYLEDEKGSEVGHIMRLPFEGGQPVNMTPELKPYTLRGFHVSDAGNFLTLTPVNADGFQLYVVELAPDGGFGRPRLIYRTPQEAWDSLPTYGGEIVFMQSTERAGGQRRYSTLAFDVASGERIGELWDGPEYSVEPLTTVPLPGDFRLLATTNRSGFRRPLVWNPRSGQRTDLPLPELQGDVFPVEFSPDGRRILLNQLHHAAQRFYFYDLDTAQLSPLDHPSGAFGAFGGFFGGAAYFGPPGEIFAHWQDAANPIQLIALDDKSGAMKRTVLSVSDVPPGHPWRSVTFPSSDGQQIQGWLSVPDGQGPFPTILEMHGGPHVVVTEFFNPSSQTWLDHGLAYLSINFRGSKTFGREFQEKIWGNIGYWELEDMVAARNWLVEQGIARPDAILLYGGSYGGYLTLWGLGKRPDLWAGGMAVVPSTDWAEAYKDASEALRGAMRAWFGGTPEEKAQEYAASSPITYAENVRAPVFIIQGWHDTRTPPRAVQKYEAKMKALGKDIQVHWFDAGHGMAKTELLIEFQEQCLRFIYRILNHDAR